MTRQILTVKRSTARKRLAMPASVKGVYSAVARKLDLSVAHVRFVALGQRTSPRVQKAIERELRQRGVSA